jgi:purine-binding chemotaxis protein CheW
MPAPVQFCTFYLDGLLFGIDVQRVQEVIRYQEMTRVPLMPPDVRGLINLRGQIVPAIDLRRRLDLPDRKESELPINVVVRSDEGPISFLVDEIGDVLEVEDETFERVPETLHGKAKELVRGVHKLPNRLLLLLDADKVTDACAAAHGKDN